MINPLVPMTHCYLVLLGRALVLKTRVHVCSNFALESIRAMREVTVHTVPGPGCLCALMLSGLWHLGT